MKKSIFVIITMVCLVLNSCTRVNSVSEKNELDKEINEIETQETSIEVTLEVDKEELLKNYIAQLYNKETDNVNDLDYGKLKNEEYIKIDEEYFELISELNTFAPNIKFLEIRKNGSKLTTEESEIIKELKSLKALDIYVHEGYEDTSFIGSLEYVSIEFNSEKENEFIIDYTEALDDKIIKYIKYEKDNMIYELVDTNPDYSDGTWDYWESKLFISSNNKEKVLIQSFDTKRLKLNSENLFLNDVNFDGYDDIILQIGHTGSRGDIEYSCYLYNNGKYKYNESFSQFSNIVVDNVNKKLYASNRESAASETVWIIEYIENEFVCTSEMTLLFSKEEKIEVAINDKDTYVVDSFEEVKGDDWSLSQGEGFSIVNDFIEDTEKAKKVTIEKEHFDDISYINDYPYITLKATDENGYIPKDNFDFIEENSENLIQYTKLEEGGMVYEEFVFEREYPIEQKEYDEEYQDWSKIVVSEIVEGNKELVQVVDGHILSLVGYTTSDIMLIDMNFDGQDDLVTYYGSVGNQYALVYNCYIYNNGKYEYHPEFYNVFNPSLDIANKRIYSNSRVDAGSRVFYIVQYINNAFVFTDELLIEYGDDGVNKRYEEIRNLHTKPIEKVYTLEDYTKEELDELFYKNRYWNLDSYSWVLE